MAAGIGLEKWAETSGDFDRAAVIANLRQLHAQAEIDDVDATVEAVMSANIARLAKWADLSVIDCRLLEFAVLICSEQMLEECADNLGNLASSRVLKVLSVVLDVPQPSLRNALSRQGVLGRSGLLSVNRNGSHSLRRKLELLSENFADLLLTGEAEPIALLQDSVTVAAPPCLQLGDYDHISDSLAILLPYLRHAQGAGQPGVNVLLHGDPGTGKSQLAKVLAKELELELYEVGCSDSNDEPVDGEHRLNGFRAAQSLLAQRPALIVFDEIEDVFDTSSRWLGGTSIGQAHKAWINQLLEENRLPALWISNSVECLDPAFVRRFDMVIGLSVPPRHQRERIVKGLCADLLSDDAMQRISQSDRLSPAVVARASSVVRSIRDQVSNPGRAVESIVSSTLVAQGHGRLRDIGADPLSGRYDPGLVNTQVDLRETVAGLAATRSGRILLYGPPGTGKTAYGHWLADQLDAPLLVKRASDLISKWVGDTEKQVAHAFDEASTAGAVLLIDEVDSFLQDRRGAKRPWEVTSVNEMLTQMERFSGVFIASTNQMADLDPAALRRFDLKLYFDYLRPQQRWRLLREACQKHNLSAPKRHLRSRLNTLSRLTPGDFASTTRRHRFRPFHTAAEWVDALVEECNFKQEAAHSPIGFT